VIKIHFMVKNHTPESIAKMSESHKGHIPWNKGKPAPLICRVIDKKEMSVLKV